jgi:hypothetical protein
VIATSWLAARRLGLISLACLNSWSCGSGKPEIPEELLAVGESSRGDYPEGPYGQELGDTVRDLSFSGYADPTKARKLEEIRFADFYDPTGEKGAKLLLVNTAAAWCQPCRIEHEALPARVREYEEEGLKVLSLLFQDPDGAPADRETLDAWVTLFDTNFPMALDPSYQMGLYGPAETPPLNLVIDPRDMTLLALFVGNQEGPMWQFIARELKQRSD